MFRAELEELKGTDFQSALSWAKQKIKPEDSLEETVAKLHLFSWAELRTRPSFLDIDTRSPQFYEKRRELVKGLFLRENIEYQAFLRSLDELAKDKFYAAKKRSIAKTLSTWYTRLLSEGTSIAGTYAAATPTFRLYYLAQFMSNKTTPGWHFYNLIAELSTTDDMGLISTLLVPRNLQALVMFDDAAEWLEDRYSSALKTSKTELKRLNNSGENSDDKNWQKYHKTQLQQIEQSISGYFACKERHQRAGRQHVEFLFDSKDNSVWREFLLYKDNFGVVATHSGIHTPGLGDAGEINYDPETELVKMRELVEKAFAMHPSRAFNFLNLYFDVQWQIPKKYQDAVEQLVHSGYWEMPRFLSSFTDEISTQRCAYSGGTIIGNEEQLLEYWYDQIVSGNLKPREAMSLPRKFYSLRKRMADTLIGKGHMLPEDAVQHMYNYALVSKILLNDPELALSIASVGLDLNAEQISVMLNNYSRNEIVERLQRIKQWSEQTQTTLTQKLVERLVGSLNLSGSLAGLDNLLSRTASGNFNIEDTLQRELEFGKYVAIRTQRNQNQKIGIDELHAEFKNLGQFPPLESEEIFLNLSELAGIERAAYEAAFFNNFVQRLRDSSSRNIYVIGNIRYGQLFVVQPLEEFLDRNVRTAYYRVSSSNTKETSVPDIFPDEFIRELSATMPHIVIVDNASLPKEQNQSRFSKATLKYANWFAAFNDLRANGDVSQYRKASSLTDNHLKNLRSSTGFADMRKKLEHIVKQGETYRAVQWMPYLEEQIIYGDVPAHRQPFEQADDRPLAVLANPIVYRKFAQGMNFALKGTNPNFWDDPEKYAGDRIVFGFGQNGIEARTDGRDKDKLIEVVQQRIVRSIGKYLRELERANQI